MPVGRHRVYTGVRVKAEFRLERRDISKLAKSTHMRNTVVGIGRKRAMAYAKTIAKDIHKTGDYNRKWRVVSRYVTYPPDRWPMRRISARLLNLSTHALLVEVGNGRARSHGHRVFGRTLLHLEKTAGPMHQSRGGL